MSEWNETCSQAPCNHEPSVPFVDPKDRRIAELEAALKELQTEFFAHQEDPQRSVTYKWSLTRIGYALTGSPSALAALLAQARREALEQGAVWLESEYYYAQANGLRQMAREVKP